MGANCRKMAGRVTPKETGCDYNILRYFSGTLFSAKHVQKLSYGNDWTECIEMYVLKPKD